MASEINEYISSLYSQKEIIADKKHEVIRHKVLLQNYYKDIEELDIRDLEQMLNFKKFIAVKYGNAVYAEPMVNSIGNKSSVNSNYGAIDELYYFKKSNSFTGPIPGFVFKTGEHGTGYYLDV